MAGRYHLYVSLACPWAHRTLIMRALKGLQDIIPISVTHWLMAENGWTFAAGEGVVPDPLYNSRYLYELYTRADDEYTGRVTVPVLWDHHTQTIVNNESADIIRMLGSAFDHVGAKAGRLLSAAVARRNRRGQPAGLRHAEQRCLQGRLRHHPGGLRSGRRAAVRYAGLAGGPAVADHATSAATR